MINGRYICSDCGKEVPEAEVNVGDWSQPSIDGEKVVPEPGAVSVGQDSVALDIPEDFIEGEKPAEPTPAVVPEPIVEAETIPETPAVNTEPLEATDTGFYQAENTPMAVDLDLLQSTLAEDTTPVTAPVATEPVPEPLVPRETTPVVLESEEVSDLEPVHSGEVSLPESTQPLPEDPEIYEDPLYDIPVPTEVAAPVQETQKMPMSKKQMIILISIGSFIVLLFIVGGIFAYGALTSTSNQEIATLPEATQAVDCDASGSSAEIASCRAENYKKCSLATWTGQTTISGNTVSMGYEITGKLNDSVTSACNIAATLKTNENDPTIEGKSMACALDSTLDVDKALATINGTTCTGELADSIFTATSAE
jgi:hypothetical protein